MHFDLCHALHTAIAEIKGFRFMLKISFPHQEIIKRMR